MSSELWQEAYERLVVQKIDEGWSEAAAEAYADEHADEEVRDYCAHLGDRARDAAKYREA